MHGIFLREIRIDCIAANIAAANIDVSEQISTRSSNRGGSLGGGDFAQQFALGLRREEV
ncbi:hypothetical protein D9M70_373620 [compost metagenome]